MKKKTYLVLQATEMEVFHAASRIYSAHLHSHSTDKLDKSKIMEMSVKEAIELAELTDAMVLSDGEPE